MTLVSGWTKGKFRVGRLLIVEEKAGSEVAASCLDLGGVDTLVMCWTC